MTGVRASSRLLPGAQPRLHLQDGPIDIILLADGEADAVDAAYRAASQSFAFILDELCAELPLLRAAAGPGRPWPGGPIARRMRAAVEPMARFGFITPKEGGKDVFVHATALERAGLPPLAENQAVRMTVVQGAKGAEVGAISLL